MDKKNILLLTTGGTIASVPGGQGLEPHRSGVMERELEQLRTYYRITVRDLICLDSSNITPDVWQLIARHIFEERAGFDGVVVSHGTDTMAYTAAALSYLIQGAAKPIILTGAQKPISFDSTDSKVNLTDAFGCACSDTLHGVMIVFNGKVIQGTRACKTRSKSYEAFSSINYPYLAVLQDGCILQ